MLMQHIAQTSAQVLATLSSYLKVLSKRGRPLALMNLAFFGSVLLTTVVCDLMLPRSLLDSLSPFAQVFLGNNILATFLSIFLYNMLFSAFLVVTLPGFAFFPLSAGFLLYRAFTWGFLLHYQPTWILVVSIPTLVLEGESYALAAVAGTIVGASWTRPKWAYKAESFKRAEALKEAFRECLGLYFFVAILLLVAAVVETATLALIAH